jgi:hypothetical protein
MSYQRIHMATASTKVITEMILKVSVGVRVTVEIKVRIRFRYKFRVLINDRSLFSSVCH